MTPTLQSDLDEEEKKGVPPGTTPRDLCGAPKSAACPRCANGVIEQYDDGSSVSLAGYAGGANSLGAWGTVDLAFEGADGKGYTRHYVAADGPTVNHWRPAEEIPELERALFWHPLWHAPGEGRRVGGQMVRLDGYELNAIARLGMLIRPPEVSDGALGRQDETVPSSGMNQTPTPEQPNG